MIQFVGFWYLDRDFSVGACKFRLHLASCSYVQLLPQLFDVVNADTGVTYFRGAW